MVDVETTRKKLLEFVELMAALKPFVDPDPNANAAEFAEAFAAARDKAKDAAKDFVKAVASSS